MLTRKRFGARRTWHMSKERPLTAAIKPVHHHLQTCMNSLIFLSLTSSMSISRRSDEHIASSPAPLWHSVVRGHDGLSIPSFLPSQIPQRIVDFGTSAHANASATGPCICIAHALPTMLCRRSNVVLDISYDVQRHRHVTVTTTLLMIMSFFRSSRPAYQPLGKSLSFGIRSLVQYVGEASPPVPALSRCVVLSPIRIDSGSIGEALPSR